MLLVVLAIGAAVMTITAISGLLGNFQIRQGYNIVNSARAFYAADTGAELSLYRFYKDRARCFPRISGSIAYTPPLPETPSPGAPNNPNCISKPSLANAGVLTNPVSYFTSPDPAAFVGCTTLPCRPILTVTGRSGGVLGGQSSARNIFFTRDPTHVNPDGIFSEER